MLEELQEVGLAFNEAKIYAFLVRRDASLVSDISQYTGIHRRNVYDSLKKLSNKGLVSSIIINGKTHYQASSPSRLKSILTEKEAILDSIMPQLLKEARAENDKEIVSVFRGIDGVKMILDDMLEAEKPVHVIGGKGKWLSPELKYFFPLFDKKRIKNKISLFQIFDYEMRNTPITQLQLCEYRFFSKNYSSPTHIWVYGDRVVTLYWDPSPLAVYIKSKKISSGYHAYFKILWKNARK